MEKMPLPSENSLTNKLIAIPKSQRLGLVFPYDWSNPEIGDEALILNVLNREIFEDVCRVCAYFGLAKVESLSIRMSCDPIATKIRRRMLENIRKGFFDAQA